MTTDELLRLANEAGIIPWNRLHWSTDQFVTIDEGMDGDLACLAQFAALVIANTRCPNCASLEAQNTELDAKLSELERKPLTEEELDELAMDEDGLPNSHIEFARAIERAHGIGDNDD